MTTAPAPDWRRPDQWDAYLKWEDAWRSRLMDLAVTTAAGDEEVFQVMAIIILAGHLAGYDG